MTMWRSRVCDPRNPHRRALVRVSAPVHWGRGRRSGARRLCSLLSPPRPATCNGLQWKWLRTAINGNLGPDYLHLSIPSGQDYLPLRLLLSSWDCNQRRWDHIKCDSPEPPSSACLYARGSICLSRERLGGAPVSYISRPGTESVSSCLKLLY